MREEHPFAQAHPLWAANLPLGRIELDVQRRIPRTDTLIVVYGEHEGVDLAPHAIARLRSIGYTQVHLLLGGLQGWVAAGGEVFSDVNVPSKAFGELVDTLRETPSLSAPEVKALLDAKANVVVLDARSYDEYQTMNIPGSISVPGAELVLRIAEIAPDPATTVIVNCAGRTRSIIGAQTLVNAKVPNRVAALRNGTIGWLLAEQKLEHGAQQTYPAAVGDASLRAARDNARRVAQAAGVRWIAHGQLDTLAESGRTLYRFDVRSPGEHAHAHLPHFLSAPGGQLVQETDHFAPVRGARLAVSDDDGVRANMTASWLAQMGWEVYVVEHGTQDLVVTMPSKARPTTGPADKPIEVAQLKSWLDTSNPDKPIVLDFTTSANHIRHHIPSAWFVLRSSLADAMTNIPAASRYVVTCGSGALAPFAASDLRELTRAEVYVLQGGTQAWIEAGLPLEAGAAHLASPAIDRYRRPYEGVNNSAATMQAYLDWEFGLVEQLKRDGTHNFRVL